MAPIAGQSRRPHLVGVEPRMLIDVGVDGILKMTVLAFGRSRATAIFCQRGVRGTTQRGTAAVRNDASALITA